ncbi:MAG: tetratricopeptide repeat protein [Streptosporangiales bacterium]|nr:tetratricopeptide repeat protein [Streptosporangiales bacterium]MBO0891239.1 tetratricopeptide repeat protein [Acidothermales bacterium]
MPDAESPLIASLRSAVAAAPDDVPLRVHLAELLLGAGDTSGAVEQAAAALQRDPASRQAREVMTRAVGTAQPAEPEPPAPAQPSPTEPGDQPADDGGAFDWQRMEDEFRGVVPPMYVDEEGNELPASSAYDVEEAGVRLADVGGLQEVKDRLEVSFLAPMRNPELRKLYGKQLRGGLLLYGPPGCGKTFLARAVAGEMGAQFISVSLTDVLEMWIGSSEKNLHELFETARRNTPCVVFLDELDAIGQKRSHTRNSGMRTTVNQLLTELDGVANNNEGVFVLGATNAPWDVDAALRRPGRFDRVVLVLPPDGPAREAIVKYHLRGRPIAGVDAGRIARATDGLSGADLAHLCDTAAEKAMLDAVRSGETRMIEMRDFEAALREVRPSIGPWLDVAKNVAMFANEGGAYNDLLHYLKKRKIV